ncbi:serine/threonine/tyrosine-interacting-like protein 1 isoform X4 [Pipistrellus kuhlii]|uniref:serine/threonine/tyrosine-interacting-like protein 1 isoform X4 n=1 Tax=Pipistrellus kuhlii TaxID=59472 RepID=UPI001E27019C|nr:serine/threonine/tyrosine-interacting-like protein 1 isoform X4 [Pipistrellus kuhlii]
MDWRRFATGNHWVESRDAAKHPMMYRLTDLVLCEPMELYNILNQVTKLSRLTEPNYLCLLDQFAGGTAIGCGKAIAHLTRYPVKILRGGYESFSAKYHFFRTQKIIWMPQELDEFQAYPVEIVPGRIYLGDFRQACDPKIQKDLKIKAHVNVSMETGPFFAGDADKLLHIQIEDSLEAFISPFLRHLCHFIDIHLDLGSVILIFSTLGISRSCAAILAYLMHRNEQTLKKSWEYVKKCKNSVRPNQALVAELSQWEAIVLGGLVTDTTVAFS